MAWRCSGRTNAELIQNLFTQGLITSPLVRDAMTAVDRAHYTPSSPHAAYEDSPQPIGHGATISAPHMHASACEALLPLMPAGKGAKVLDIGSGSGYLTHVLANLVCGVDGKEDGKVVGIDHIKSLVDMARTNISRSEQGRHLLSSGKIELVTGDGRKGYPDGGPYNAIHVGAAAKEMHPILIEQLDKPGRMFIPVEDGDGWGNQWIWVVDKDVDGKVTRKKDMGVRYVPLTDAPV
jgi:protein-L-isoaspartate(D-aspartate) O-methyltransferase